MTKRRQKTSKCSAVEKMVKEHMTVCASCWTRYLGVYSQSPSLVKPPEQEVPK